MKEIKLSNNIKNVGKISAGTLLGQIISVVSVPILTRMYGADVIGYWSLFNSIATVINSVSDLGLTNAIMTEEVEENTHLIYKVTSSINFIVSVISFFIIYVYYTFFSNDKNYNALFFSVIISILIITLQQIQINYTWLNKKQKYDVLMKNPIINQLAIFLFAVVFAYLKIKKYGYFVAIIIGQIFTLLNMRSNLPKGTFTFKIGEYKLVIKKNIDFVKYQLPTTGLTNLKNQLPTFFIKSLFGATFLGYYSITQKILNVPIQLLGNAIGKVFFSTISKMKRNGVAIGNYVFNNLKKASYLAIVPMICLISFGDYIILFLFGAEYKIAAEMLKIVSFQTFFTFLMMATSGIYITIGKQSYALKSIFAQILVYIAGFYIGAHFNSIYIALYITTLFYSVIQIVYFSFIFRSLDISPFKYVVNICGISVVILGGAFIVNTIINILIN